MTNIFGHNSEREFLRITAVDPLPPDEHIVGSADRGKALKDASLAMSVPAVGQTVAGRHVVAVSHDVVTFLDREGRDKKIKLEYWHKWVRENS